MVAFATEYHSRRMAPSGLRRRMRPSIGIGLRQPLPYKYRPDILARYAERPAASSIVAEHGAFSARRAGTRDALKRERPPAPHKVNDASLCVIALLNLGLAFGGLANLRSVEPDETIGKAADADRVAIDHVHVARPQRVLTGMGAKREGR